MVLRKILCTVCMLYVVLGSWKGYVAIFEENKEEPRQIFPYLVASLPEEDQKALEKGIIVRSDRKLQELLEDYLS